MSALLALVTAVIGSIPLIKTPKRVWVGVFYFLMSWLVYYAGLPSLAFPLLGALGGLTIAALFVSSTVASFAPDRRSDWQWHFGWTLPGFGLIALIVTGFGGCSAFRSNEYKALIGNVEKREWTQDVQPKDPRHVRLVPIELAYYLATKQLGEAKGAIGSQFQIETNALTLQMVKGELWYIAPLDFKGYRAWTSADSSPGYVMVHAEDPKRPIVVKTGEKFHYLNSAWFGDSLERLLWKKYAFQYVLRDFTFEVDDNGKAWWTVTASKPTISWWGEKAVGVIVVDPTTGADTFYSIANVPKWIDRVVPDQFIKEYVADFGAYQNGWVNSWWGHKDIFEPEEPSIAYGADGDPYWVTSVTSVNNHDKSMVGLVYTDCRTGKSVMYHASGGTEFAVVELVNNKVSYRKLHGRSAQLYNIYGAMTSVVPLLGESHSFQGVAFVDVANMQVVVGDDIETALRQYQRSFASSGQQVAPEKRHDLKTVDGTVSRFAAETRSGDTSYYVYLEGTPHVFMGGDVSPKLRLTKTGDRVKIGFIDSTEDVVPIETFDNFAIVLTQSKAQADLRQQVTARQQEVQTGRAAKNVKAELDKMSPEEIQKLLDLRNKK